MGKEMIAGVIVTYNRKVLLSENLKQQFMQKKTLDKIVIIDNAGTDDTLGYLTDILTKDQMDKIDYTRLQINIGCAAAFAMGMKKCFELGYNWAYVMDDDGKPMNDSTISELFEHIYKNNYTSENSLIVNSLVLENESKLSFKLYESFSIDNALSHIKDGVLLGEAKLWNGTLISKGTFKKIGVPNELFGFKGEEVDYKNRAKKSKVLICTVPTSLYQHPTIKEKSVQILGKSFYFSLEPDWKYYYIVRNRVYMLWIEKKYLRAYLFYFKFIYCLKQLSPSTYRTSKTIIDRAFSDGKKSQLGIVKDIS